MSIWRICWSASRSRIPDGHHTADVRLPADGAGPRRPAARRAAEGGDDRVLQAAGRLLVRGLADLTILGRSPGPFPRSRTRCRPGWRDGDQPAHQPRTAASACAERVRRVAQSQGRGQVDSRDHPRCVLLRHHDGAQRPRRRDGVRGSAPPRTPFAGLRDHQDQTRVSTVSSIS